MGYSIVDLLDNLIVIEQNTCRMYRYIASSDSSAANSLKTVAMVLAKEEERHIAFYQNIKKEVSLHKDIEIDFDIYDKASSLVLEFKKFIAKPQAKNAEELVQYALNMERENVALLLNVQGRLVRKPDDRDTMSYLALSDLITEEQKHINNLQVFANK